MGEINGLVDRTHHLVLLCQLSFLIHVGSPDNLETFTNAECLTSRHLQVDNMVGVGQIRLVTIHDESRPALMILLLKKSRVRVKSILNEGLLSIAEDIQWSCHLLHSLVNDSCDALMKSLELGDSILIDAPTFTNSFD